MKCRVSTTATVQFAVNYAPQCFNANAPYSVLSRFIIIKSMAITQYIMMIAVVCNFVWRMPRNTKLFCKNLKHVGWIGNVPKARRISLPQITWPLSARQHQPSYGFQYLSFGDAADTIECETPHTGSCTTWFHICSVWVVFLRRLAYLYRRITHQLIDRFA